MRLLALGLVAGTVASSAALASIAVARPTGINHKIVETQTVAGVATLANPTATRFRSIGAGTLDGKLGTSPIHGAFRALIVDNFSTGSGTARVTEYDAGGSRSALIEVKFTISNGQFVDTGTGRWTGGTGLYANCRGTFTVNTYGPVGGVLNTRLTGHINY